MNEGAYREPPPPTKDEFNALAQRVDALEGKSASAPAPRPEGWLGGLTRAGGFLGILFGAAVVDYMTDVVSTSYMGSRARYEGHGALFVVGLAVWFVGSVTCLFAGPALWRLNDSPTKEA